MTTSESAATLDVPFAPGRVVVGADGSASSISAVRWAASYARAFGLGLDVLISWYYPASYGMAGGDGGWRPDRDANTTLKIVVDEVFGDGPPPGLRTLVEEGHPARVLVGASRGASLLVVGSRGHGGFTGLLLGSVSAHCAEHAYCPVVVDRQVGEPAAAAVA
jgi:nucleotide-binding universal stress UspA family protein